MMDISERGKTFIKQFEGCKLKAYLDGGGVPTIGYGHTHGVKMGDVITQHEADEIFDLDIRIYVEGVNGLVKVPLHQSQFDALVSFAFNVGLDIDTDDIAEGLGDSTLLKKLNRRDYLGAADEFPKWCKDNGVTVPGLLRRRNAELAMYLLGE